MMRTTAAKTAVVIPCLNEAQSITAVLEEIPRWAVDQVYVVDNGSTDGTGLVAAMAGARVVREEQRGYGWACWAGFEAARANGADVILFLDGDRSDPAEQIPDLLAPVMDGTADLALGRPYSLSGAPSHRSGWGIRAVTLLLRWLYRVHLNDVPSFRAIRTEALAALALKERTFGWPVEMVVRAARKGYTMVEVPVHYRKRPGRNKPQVTLWAAFMAGLKLVWAVLRHAARRD